MSSKRCIAATVLTLLTDLAVSPMARAQNSTAPQSNLEEVVVTAEKREVALQDIPIAIYAVSGKSLENSGITTVQGLTQLAPSLQFAKSTNTFYMTIRGVGSETTDLGADPAIALTQDGITLVRPQMLNADFLDVGRIEVLRGPQGTIAGRNATAGAINVLSNRPTETFEGKVSVTAGKNSLFKQETVLSGPLVGTQLLGRIAFGTENADGWIENTYVDRSSSNGLREQDLNDAKKSHLRASLLAQPSDAFQALLTIDHVVDKSVTQSGILLGNGRGDGLPDELDLNNAKNGTAIVHPNVSAMRTQSDIRQSQDVEQTLAALKLSYDLTPDTTLTSNTGYVRRLSSQYADYDGTAAILTENTPIEFNSKVFSQELTLLTKPLDSLDLIVGGLYLHDESEEPLVFRSDNFGATSPGIVIPNLEQTTRSSAVYAQVRYFFTDKLHLDLGARYTKDEKTIDFGPQSFNGLQIAGRIVDTDSWNAFTPRLAVHFDASDAVALYASVSRGYKAGGYNALSAPQQYNPEYVTTAEAGVKYRNPDVNAGLTAFYSDYKDIQQNIYLPNDVGTPSAQVRNASRARITGIEAEIDARVTDAVRLFGNATIMHARIDEALGVDPTFPELGLQNFDGHRLTRSPDYQATVGGEIEQPVSDNLTWYLNTSYRWQSRMYFDIYNNATASQAAYGVLNLRTGFQNREGDWQATAYVNNILDEQYFSNKINLGLVTSSTYGDLGAPRLWGINVTHRF